MDSSPNQPLPHKIDRIRLYVADLDAGFAFYRGQLGHSLEIDNWLLYITEAVRYAERMA